MARYRAKPRTVEAEQWRPGDEEQAKRLGLRRRMSGIWLVKAWRGDEGGWHPLDDYDWIVTHDDHRKLMSDAEFQEAYELDE